MAKRRASFLALCHWLKGKARCGRLATEFFAEVGYCAEHAEQVRANRAWLAAWMERRERAANG